MPEDPRTDNLPNLAERLDRLFRTVKRADDPSKLHSAGSVAEELAEKGITVNPNHIRALRAGSRANPSFRLLAGLAEIFHVPLDYFTDDDTAQQIDESLEALAAMRDAGVEKVMLRSHGVSQESLDSVLNLLDQIRRIEGLDNPDEQEGEAHDD